ncbi:YihY/virulence factor BrkB family protein [Chelatococcus reniformis]|uniref:YihY/virulence factor BrkB family protein n=1 Tax=Chelatococcus reniformis TaxID=1494448 RepID=A0A916UU47_9HYPH|nr:YihY/virulence factor BrkB family protein [Chelatococcus reniformis]GGC87901.1 hypothetical protein GCM10010994_52350 [Chelatococcus reniformis]
MPAFAAVTLLASAVAYLVFAMRGDPVDVRRPRETLSEDRAPPRSVEPHGARVEQGRGRSADSPTDIPARGWKDILVRVYKNLTEQRLFAIAAGVTFYSILALFPAIAAFVALYGLFADSSTISSNLQSLSGVLPEGGMAVLDDQLRSLAAQPQDKLGLTFFVSIALALWSANAGMKALLDALNVVYGEREKRGFFKLNAISLSLTIGAMVLLIASAAAVVVLPAILDMVWLGALSEGIVRFGRWPLLLFVVGLALAVVYRYGPSRDAPQWRWVTAGSGVAAVIWLAASILFSWYASEFGSYNRTYGSLGAIIGFMVWIWISSIVVLLGAELDAEMEHQTVKDTTQGSPVPLGARGAQMADTVGAAQG